MDIGTKINHYTIVEHIGRGGMADVWSARDEKLNRMVAVKTIAHGLSQEADPVGMFKREAQTIATMEHPHILPIYDFGEVAGQLYIVMRYVAGGSLDDLMSQGALQTHEVLRLGEAIAKALDYAHSKKVIHLDLKPPNILMDSQDAPYLADFGLATKLDPQGKASNPGAGTLLYMAPEQLTAEMLDHRADIYSFSVLLFHMLAGELPFEAQTPMALKQLQYHEDMPNITDYNPDLPEALNEILRQGASLNPDSRPQTMTALIDALRSVIAPVAALEAGENWWVREDDNIPEFIDEPYPLTIEELEMLEAVDIYSRARHAWGGGNGRFLLGVTHFMIMNGYYKDAEKHDLDLDTTGKQMLLRGALEYDIDVDYWWDQQDDDSRRWVCLHAIRSGNAPARVRALYRLETLPDSEKPQIPRLVAQALQVENNQEARIAALQVLSTRARLMKRPDKLKIQTEYRGRMLTTMTRLGIQLSEEQDWTEVVYTPEIDLLIAETALDQSMPRVANFAARVIGRIRSTAAVRYVVNEQQKGRKGALRALALIRDETPSLPEPVNRTARFYAWLNNTLRRMLDRPMTLVWRYLFALFGGWLAMGFHVYSVYRTQAVFAQQRWANAIAIGLIFGILVAWVPMFADEFPSRLRRFWQPWLRAVVALVIGTLWGMVAWWSFIWFYIQGQPGIDVLLFGGFGLGLGYALRTMFNLRSWLAIPLTAFLTYIPIYVTFFPGWLYQDLGPFSYGEGVLQFDEALLYYQYGYNEITGDPLIPTELFTVAIPFAVLVAVGGYLPLLVAEVRAVVRRSPIQADRPQADEHRQEPKVTPVPNLDTVAFDAPPESENWQTRRFPGIESDPNDGDSGTMPLPNLENMKTATEQDLYKTATLQDTPNTVDFSANPNMATALDLEKGLTDDEQDNIGTERVDISTGIIVNPANVGTEIDVNQGRQDDSDNDDDDDDRTMQGDQTQRIPD